MDNLNMPPRDSIFTGAIRSFFSALGAILGILIGIGIIIFLFSMLFPPSLVPEKTEITIAADAEGKREPLASSSPVILRVNFNGIIGEPMLDSNTIEDILIDSREGMLKQRHIKGVFLHINSPGGSATDADNIYRMLKEYKKKYNVPIYAFVDGLCASGGMYIACAADKIYSTSASVIGSIGVLLGPNFNFSGTMEKIGVESLTITQGKDKDALNPFRPWVPGEDQSIRDITAALYDRFVSIVSEARPMLTREKLVNEYGAHVFIAPKAQEYGYIDDADADYSKALTALVQQAQIGEKEAYQVFELQPKINFLSELTQSKFSLLKGKVTHVFQIGPNLNSEMSGKFLYLYQP